MAHICLGVRELAAGPDPTWQKKPSQSWGLGAASSGAPLSPEQLSPGLSSKNSHRRVRLAPQGSGKSPVVPAKEDPASSLSTWPSSAGWAAATPCPTSPGPPCPLAPAHVACTPPPAQLTDPPPVVALTVPSEGRLCSLPAPGSAVFFWQGRKCRSSKAEGARAAWGGGHTLFTSALTKYASRAQVPPITGLPPGGFRLRHRCSRSPSTAGRRQA